MTKMFKRLENELDMVHSSFSKTYAYAKNVETFAEYILEDDDRGKYTKDMIDLVEEIYARTEKIFDKITLEQDFIEKIKEKIVEMC